MWPGWSALENITLVGTKVRWGVFGFVAVFFFGCLGDEGVGMAGAAVFFCFCLCSFSLVIFLGVGFVVVVVFFFLGVVIRLVEHPSCFFGVRLGMREVCAVVVGEGE